MAKGKGLKKVGVIELEVGLGGAATDGSVALTPNDTWVQVPDTVPVTDYLLVVTKENEAGTIRWSFTNGGVPGVANGNKMWNDDMIMELRGGEVIYMGSSTDGDDVNYTTKIL